MYCSAVVVCLFKQTKRIIYFKSLVLARRHTYWFLVLINLKMGSTLSVEENAYSQFAKELKKQNVDYMEPISRFNDNCSGMNVIFLDIDNRVG